MKSFQKYQFTVAFFCLTVAFILWLVEAFFLSPTPYKHEESPYAFCNLASFIHNFVGYKILFPAIGIFIIAIFAYILRPLLTKEEERP